MKFTDLPEYFRYIRENLGYSRYKAAQMAQMNNESLKDLETGETHRQVMEYYDHLMKVYDIHSITITDHGDEPTSITVNFNDFSPAGRRYFQTLLKREEQLRMAADLNSHKHKQRGQ